MHLVFSYHEFLAKKETVVNLMRSELTFAVTPCYQSHLGQHRWAEKT